MHLNDSNLVESIINIIPIVYALCRVVAVYVNYEFMIFFVIFLHLNEYAVSPIYLSGSSLPFGYH